MQYSYYFKEQISVVKKLSKYSINFIPQKFIIPLRKYTKKTQKFRKIPQKLDFRKFKV